MANTIPSDLQVNLLMRSALRAFSARVLPIANLSTVFRSVPLSGTDIVSVPYYPLVTAASTDFSSSYSFGNTTTEARNVTVNKRKYQSMSVTSSEWNRQPAINWEQLGTIKGEKLAQDVVADILSVVTAANYGAAAFTGAASTFDSDDVGDIRKACNLANWPKDGRTLLVDTAYDSYLYRDSAVKNAQAYGENGVIKEGALSKILGFDYFESALIPANGENLVGMALYRSAILIAFSPITPEPSVEQQLSRYMVSTDPLTGLTLEYREWGNPDSDACRRVLECNYGYAKGEAAAIKRMVSA